MEYLSQKIISVYTDGSCLFNPGGKGGWAYILLWGSKKLSCSGFSLSTTNNRMELTAAIEALESIKIKKTIDCEGKINVFTDSKYVILCINGYRKWLSRKKKNIKNLDLVSRLVKLSESLFVQWEWVKGHAENQFNKECDFLAVKAAKRQQSYREFVRV
jgi:ribonuclease HI